MAFPNQLATPTNKPKPKQPLGGKFHPSQEKGQFIAEQSHGNPPQKKPIGPGALEGPQAGEQFFDQNQDKFTAPSAGAQWWEQNQGKLGNPGQAENWAMENAQQLKGQGAGAQWWAQNQGKLGNPGASEQFWDQMAPSAQNQTRSDQAAAAFQAGPAGLDPYYERATARAMASTNDALAARGMHGSSKGLTQLGDTAAALSAEQANREADFRLKQQQLGGQLANQADSANMSQMSQMGNLANSAQGANSVRMGQGSQMSGAAGQEDITRLMSAMQAAQAGQGAMTDRMGLGSQMAGAADSSGLNMLTSGQNAANSAQQLKETRLQNMLQAMLAPMNGQQNILGNAQNQMLGADRDAFDGITEANLAAFAQLLSNSQSQTQQAGADFGNVMELVGSFSGGGGGMGK